MWKQRAVTLCGCLAILPIVTGCTYGVGGPPQAFMSGPDYAPPETYSPPQAYASPQAYALPRTYVPAAPITAQPAGSDAAQVYAIGPSAPAAIVVMLPGPGELTTASPRLWADQGFDVVTPMPSEFYQIAADQQAAAARLIAQAQALADAPIWLVGPNRAIQAAMASMPPGGPGQVSGVVVTSTSTGASTCSEQMSYSYSGNGAPPKVSVSKSGNACPPGSPFGARSIGPGANSIEAPPQPAVRPHTPRLIETSTPPARLPPPRVIEAALPAQSDSPAQQQAVQQISEMIKAAPPS
jgi:hypothetical protein